MKTHLGDVIVEQGRQMVMCVVRMGVCVLLHGFRTQWGEHARTRTGRDKHTDKQRGREGKQNKENRTWVTSSSSREGRW